MKESIVNKGHITVAADAAELARKGAELFCQMAKETLERQGYFAVAISGGSTPRAMYRLLSQEPYMSAIPWQQTHIFWVDERMVPADHPASNYGTTKKDLIEKIPISGDQIFPMPGHMNPEEASSEYQTKLETFFIKTANNYPVFDLILLGIGSDGHTASLFPGDPSAETRGKWVISTKGGNPDVFRLTLTFEIFNQARCICFLVSGKEKALVMKTLFEDPNAQLPPQKIRPARGKLIWLLDTSAASLLTVNNYASEE